MKSRFPALPLLGAMLVALPAFAHHSFAMFDRDASVTVEGTVKRFQWTNPHSWIILSVPNAAGEPEDWPIEMGAPRGLSQQGWTPRTLTPGMKIRVLIHPLKDEGKPGGQFMSVTLPDGTELSTANDGEPE